jgi:hypothetical protein
MTSIKLIETTLKLSIYHRWTHEMRGTYKQVGMMKCRTNDLTLPCLRFLHHETWHREI